MVVALVEGDLELDPPEERRRRMEDEPVCAGGHLGERGDAPVGVRLGRRDELLLREQLDPDAGGRPATLRVQDVRGEGRRHVSNRRA